MAKNEARSNGQAHRRKMRREATPKRTIAVERPTGDRLYNIAKDLGVTGQDLATKALEWFFASSEGDPKQIKKIALRARLDEIMNEAVAIEEELNASDKPVAPKRPGTKLGAKRGPYNKKAKVHANVPRYNTGFAVDGSSQAAQV